MSDNELQSIMKQLVQQIGASLGVKSRSIQVQLLERQFVSYADVSWPPTTAHITISRNRLTPSFLAHEITHCLVPTRALFFAEGLATWIGCQYATSCADLCFSEQDVDDIVRLHHTPFSLEQLVGETIGECKFYAPDVFHLLQSRLAHAFAASFMRWFCQRHPSLPAKIAMPSCSSPATELSALSGMTLAELEGAWRADLVAPKKVVPYGCN